MNIKNNFKRFNASLCLSYRGFLPSSLSFRENQLTLLTKLRKENLKVKFYHILDPCEKSTVSESSASLTSNDENNRCQLETYWHEHTADKKEDIKSIKRLDGEKICRNIRERVQNDSFKLIDIPSNILGAMDLIRGNNFDYEKLEALIKHSPVMVTEILRVANSALFAGIEPVSTLREAFPRLGANSLLSVLYVSTTRTFIEGKEVLTSITEEIVDHSYAVGKIAAHLAKKYYENADDGFLAGLLHDIGKIAIISDIVDNDEIRSENHGVSEYLLENILIPLHEQVGGIVVNNFKINADVCFAVSNHHKIRENGIDASKYKLAALINLSDTIARILGKSRWIDEVDLLSTPAAKILGIKETDDDINFLSYVLLLFEDTKDMYTSD